MNGGAEMKGGPTRELAIPRAFGRLENAISELTSVTEIVENRLGPILNPHSDPPTGPRDENAKLTAKQCPMVEALTQAALRVEALHGRLSFALNRFEL